MQADHWSLVSRKHRNGSLHGGPLPTLPKDADVNNPMYSQLRLDKAPPDEHEAIATSYLASFFSNNLARLFKLPTAAPIIKLCKAMLDTEASMSDCGPEEMERIPDMLAANFDTFILACRALRAVVCPRPYPGGTQAAIQMFAPPSSGPPISKALGDLANSVRSSQLWLPIHDEYWGLSGNDDRLADNFQQADEELNKAVEDGDALAAVCAVDKASVLQDYKLNALRDKDYQCPPGI